jgi:hypothetical protein
VARVMDGPGVHGWRDVLDQKIDLLRFWMTPEGARTGAAWATRIPEGATREEILDGEISEEAIQAGADIARREAIKLSLAEPFYVDPDMWTLVEAAEAGFEPEPLQATDLLTSHGFVVLPRPVVMIDRNEKRMTARAFAWAPCVMPPPEGSDEPTKSGIYLSLYSHLDDVLTGPDDFGPDSLLTADDFRALHADMGTPYSLAHITPWAFGDEMPSDPDLRRWHSTWWRPVQTFFRISLQTITDRYQQQAPRASRRRAAKFMKRPPDDYITVIRLRRPKQKKENGEAGPVEWSHQWIVGGFWRWQYYPSLGIHRQIYIHDYVKGPKDKPLLVRKGRAFEFVR